MCGGEAEDQAGRCARKIVIGVNCRSVGAGGPILRFHVLIALELQAYILIKKAGNTGNAAVVDVLIDVPAYRSLGRQVAVTHKDVPFGRGIVACKFRR